WRLWPGTNATERPQLERLALDQPEGFSSLCLASNLVIWTSAKGSRVLPSQKLDCNELNESDWVRTSEGLSRASPDAHWLTIFRSYSYLLDVYRLPSLEWIAKLTNHASIGHVVFSPLGDEVAVSSRDRVEFRSTTSWQRTRTITNFCDIV